MAKVLKQMLASQLLKALSRSDGAVFVDLGPMTVEQSSRLRGVLLQKAGGARLKIIHNRTARAAFREAGWPPKLETILKGPTAVAYGGEGAPTIARTLTEWKRGDRNIVLALKGAVTEGEFYDAKGATALARLPDKRTVRAMTAQALLAPGRGLAVAIAGTGAGLARVLKARIDAQGFAPDPAAS